MPWKLRRAPRTRNLVGARFSLARSKTPMFLFGAHTWRGESGTRYRFKSVLTKGGLPPEGIGGIYIFIRRRWVFFLEPLYVGKAHDLRSRLLGHEKWPRAFWYYGATERHVSEPIRDEIDRRRVEEDLIHGLRPRMNDVEIPKAGHDAKAHGAQLRRWFGLSMAQKSQASGTTSASA